MGIHKKVFSSIGERRKGVQLMQKWPEKGWHESYSKDVMKRTLITDGGAGKKKGINRLVLLKNGWCT